MRWILIGLVVFFVAGSLQSQTRAPLSPEVRAFVKVDAPVIALRHVRVIDGTGAAARENQTLVIAGGKITAIGGEATTPVPAGATVIELPEYSVIPGIVGMHEHMYYPTPNGPPAMLGEHATSFPRLYLAGGVTTMRTTGSLEPYTDLEIKRAIDEGTMLGPKMRITGPYIEGEGAFALQMHQLRDAEDARRTAEYWMDEGVTSFKAYMHLTPDELAALVKAAHARGVKVTGHLGSIGFREAAAIGIDDLEHGLVVDTEFFSGKKPGVCPDSEAATREMAEKLDVSSAPVQEMIRDLVARKVAVTSTLPVFETFVPGRAPQDARILDAMTDAAKASYQRARAAIAAGAAQSYWPALFKKELQFEHDFAKAGGLLLAGLDPTGYGGVIPGFGDQREIELLVEAGFTPVEAIHIATSNGAQFLGELEQIGTLAVGKAADIVVIHGDPSTTIADVEKVDTVFKDGIGYDPAKLIESAKGLVGLR
ncbi:MAG: amidohydrolase family protein [Planctomycetes bacterium]|nr:amidohydrolase family protein [Planctomycetota bacterium]